MLARRLTICALAVSLAVPCLPGIARADEYKHGPDSERHDGVPKGTVEHHEWKSKIYPDTIREYWVYVPKQYDPAHPACLMVFQDGHAYVNEHGDFRAPIVFDNLIDKRQMPVTIGLFINPGMHGDKLPADGWKADDRSVEYDTVSNQYARFLLEEMLPEVGKQYKLTDQAAGRGICGSSSGGICSFTVAWQRPDAFSKVVSFIGSFTNIRGGYVYPPQIRASKKNAKPIRVFLQDGSHDLDNQFGNWPLANQEMAAALKFAGYDYRFEFGTGAHDGKQAGAIFPDAMRWIWRDYKSP
ncbi:MAG TPA: alpha/beta hydrolase-fold protein [Pirellulales bacterium]|jgi:enterochelin esterase family protein|nr:alpha/beta hydrolase-fold protein [Pirellulales bacterium]